MSVEDGTKGEVAQIDGRQECKGEQKCCENDVDFVLHHVILLLVFIRIVLWYYTM